METTSAAAVWADQQIAAVRDDPSARVALAERTYQGPYGRAPRHLPYRRAAMSFMRWQLQRGVLAPADSDRPGSPWWRAVNERLLRDGCETVALSGDLGGRPSSRTVEQWMSYPLRDEVRSYLSDELGFGRLLDFGLIVPRVQELYHWSAHELGAPGLLDCARERALTYAWPFEDRDVWVARRSITVAMMRRAIPAARRPHR